MRVAKAALDRLLAQQAAAASQPSAADAAPLDSNDEATAASTTAGTTDAVAPGSRAGSGGMAAARQCLPSTAAIAWLAHNLEGFLEHAVLCWELTQALEGRPGAHAFRGACNGCMPT